MAFTRAQEKESDFRKIARCEFMECLQTDNIIESLTMKLAEKLFPKLEEKLVEMFTKYDLMEGSIRELKQENEVLKCRISDLEQTVQCANTLRICGLPEAEKDDSKSLVTKFFREKLDVDFQEDIIVDTRRIIFNQSGRRLCQLQVKIRDQHNFTRILTNRKKLKNSKVFIMEELTKNKLELLNIAKQRLDRKNVWVWHGNIWANVNGKKVKIGSRTDLEDNIKRVGNTNCE